MMQKLSPVLFVDSIEAALPFFRERLGFTVGVSVPLREGAAELGFVILSRDAVEIMLQTHASVRLDVPAVADQPSRAFLFLEVEDIEAIVAAVRGVEVVVPRRKTFYGADEIGVRAPGGHVLLFAQMDR
ncbi:MAG: VOC family protein [Planctomycetes bacterium]|nr:VOC family protein [Planctomycetota bacterium]